VAVAACGVAAVPLLAVGMGPQQGPPQAASFAWGCLPAPGFARFPLPPCEPFSSDCFDSQARLYSLSPAALPAVCHQQHCWEPPLVVHLPKNPKQPRSASADGSSWQQAQSPARGSSLDRSLWRWRRHEASHQG